MVIKRSKYLPAGEAVIIKDTDTLLHNIINFEIKQLDKELSKANDKLKKIEKYCESTKEKYKYYNECNTTDVRVISKIIKGDD